MMWDLTGQHYLYWPVAAFAGCSVIRESGRRGTARRDAGEVLGHEQDSKDASETLAEGVMCKGKVLSTGVPALEQWPGACLRVSWEEQSESRKEGVMDWKRWEAWARPWCQSCFGNCMIVNSCPGHGSSHSLGCGWLYKVGHEEGELEEQQD